MQVLIQYVGGKPRKTDNVRNTGRVWEGPGSVLVVPVADAGFYLAYPEIWRQVTQEQAQAYAESLSDEHLPQVLLDIQKLSKAGLTVLFKAVQDAITQSEAPAVVVTESLGEETHKGHTHRIRQIAAAIKELDLHSDEFAGKDGMPYPRAVQDQCGILPSHDEIVEAMQMLGHAPTHNSRAEAIKAAVSLMEADNPKHFTSTGRPRIEKIRELTGIQNITVAEIAEAI